MSDGLNAVLVGTLSLGGLLALVGAGFNLIYRTTKVVNFAQGSFLALGAYMTTTFVASHGRVIGPALALLISAVLGVVVYVVLIRGSLGREEFAVIILTFGVSIVLTSVISIIWGTTRHSIGLGLPRNIVDVLGLRIDALSLITLVSALVIIGALALVMRYTSWGLRARATAQHPWLAAKYGISVHMVGATAWAVSLVLATYAGILYGELTGVEITIAAVGLIVFPAIILGGLDSLPGALLGGLIVGAIISGTTYLYGPDVAQVVVYGVLVLALTFLPQGILGQRLGRQV